MEKLTMKVLRVKANLTQAQTAEKLGINRATYSKWENYETYPDALQLIALAKIFECSLDAFYFPVDTNQKLASA